MHAVTSTFTAIPILSGEELASALDRATAWGGHGALYELAREQEMTPTALLVSAQVAAFDLAPSAVMLQAQLEVGAPSSVPALAATIDGVHGISAASLRLALRALQIDARNAAIKVGDRLVGYSIDRWLTAATHRAQITLMEARDDRIAAEERPTVGGVARRAHERLGAAIIGCEQDRMAVAERTAEGLGDLLAIFVLAEGLRNR